MLMKLSRWTGGLLLCVLLGNVQAQLKIGQEAPSFQAEAALAGKPYQFSLSESLKKGPVVVYFYPKAFTSGCSIEANLFAQAADEFAQYGATVVGVSGDDIETLERFSNGPCGGKFAVASDADRSIMRAYDATMFSPQQWRAHILCRDTRFKNLFCPQQYESRSACQHDSCCSQKWHAR